MTATKFYCDMCGNEISSKNVRSIGIKFSQDLCYEELLICDKCYDSIRCDGIDINTKEYRKKKFSGILKLWGSKRG